MTEPELSPLEQDFKETFEKYYPKIQKKIDEARKLMRDATKLADKHGLSFASSISPIYQHYYPGESKFSEICGETLLELTDDEIYSLDSGYGYGGSGWERSAIC